MYGVYGHIYCPCGLKGMWYYASLRDVKGVMSIKHSDRNNATSTQYTVTSPIVIMWFCNVWRMKDTV